MLFSKRSVKDILIALALLGTASVAGAQQQSTMPSGLHFTFDYEMARIASKAVSAKQFDEATSADICSQPVAAAMQKKMNLKDCNALLLHLKNLEKGPKTMVAAALLAAELSKQGDGKYGALAAEVSRQIKQYLPEQFQAQINVHFIFGSYSGGFAFDDVPDDVYVNLAFFSDASIQELAETVSHELFHAVQSHVMKFESLPSAAGQPAVTGPIWVRHLLANLEQEGTSELFTHPIVDRPSSLYSTRRKLGIERNATRIGNLPTLFETLAWRLLYVPPADENAYDNIYGLMFYTDFDETGYDLGWLMASSIAKKDGKMAIFSLLKEDPRNFVLRYQQIALEDGKLPTFSAEFVREIKAL